MNGNDSHFYATALGECRLLPLSAEEICWQGPHRVHVDVRDLEVDAFVHEDAVVTGVATNGQLVADLHVGRSCALHGGNVVHEIDNDALR